jgi:hypothetical protein
VKENNMNKMINDTTSPSPARTLAKQFHAQFLGSARSHGSYSSIAPDPTRGDGKNKGVAVTLREPVTDELWEGHLAGTYGLGIIPIRDDGTNTCSWGCIDVDVYSDLDLGSVAAQIAKMKLPLVPCRSKSGGIHVLAFSAEPVPASLMQRKLQDLAARLGFAKSEIFPKQTVLNNSQDCGSWLNMPYMDSVNTNRYAVLANGDALNAEEFLVLCELAKQPPEWFAQPLARTTDPLPDGPPCLNHLMQMGFPPGTWNCGTFNLGVFARKKYPDDWKGHLVQLNALNFPIDKWPSSDLDGIFKSLSKKDYSYQCNTSPLLEHCDRGACRKRKYGVGGSGSLPTLSSLTKLLTTPPIWFLEVEGVRVELSTEQLLNPLQFQIVCADNNVLVPVIGRGAWVEYLRPCMASVNEVPVCDDGSGDDDSSAKSHFLDLLESFCMGRAQGHDMNDILMGKPFTENGRTYFRFLSLTTFLTRVMFKFRRNDIVAILKGLGATNRQDRVGGRVTRVWSVPAFARGDTTPLPVPPGLLDQKPF